MIVDQRIRFARWLVDAGAGASARNVLGSLRGAEANRIRLLAKEARLRAGVYALVTMPDGLGATLPLRPSPGHPRATDRAFREACVTAYELARLILQDRSLPMLRFELEEELAVFGPSIGLPAALAFLSFYAPARAPDHPVLASGALTMDGRVGPVGGLEAKLAIAKEERADGPDSAAASVAAELVLLPAEVSTFEEATKRMFGERPLHLDMTHAVVDDLLYRARTLALPAESIALLESVDRETLAPADRARVLFDLGTFYRNRGKHRRAWALHSEARALLETERHGIGEESSERYELECWATELDQYRIEEATRALRARLARPFLKLRNELRCRGMLALGLAMKGDYAESVRVREANLALHDRSDALGKIRPLTLCMLALDAGLGRNAAVFERSVIAVGAATRPGDEQQWRYNAMAIVRGLVALGRHEEAIAFANDESRAFDCRAPATLVMAARGEAKSITAPEIAALRALVRAYRKSNRVADAVRVGRQATKAASAESEDLFGWMAALLNLEVALAESEASHHEESESRTREAWDSLNRTHKEATTFHATLLDPNPAKRESELGRVFY